MIVSDKPVLIGAAIPHCESSAGDCDEQCCIGPMPSPRLLFAGSILGNNGHRHAVLFEHRHAFVSTNNMKENMKGSR
jgi:hypothetical protein